MRALRRDAREHREALLRAAAECFDESGFNVSLESIAERAGVGRGTLYRNFEDRYALAFAIFEREIGEMEKRLDPDLPVRELLRTLVREGLFATHLFGRLKLDMRLEGDRLLAFEALGGRLEQLLRPAADRARAAGDLRLDVQPRHLVLAMRMIAGVVHYKQANEEADREIDEALDLILKGLQAV